MGVIIGLIMAFLISLFNFNDDNNDNDVMHNHSQTTEEIAKKDKHYYSVPEVNKDKTATIAIALFISIMLLI